MEHYIGGWQGKSNFKGNPFNPKNIPATGQNHLDFLGWDVDPSGLLTPAYPDELEKQLKVLQETKQLYPSFKVSLTIIARLDNIFLDSSKSETFVKSCLKIIEENGFDGLTLDWEWPPAGHAKEVTEFYSTIKNQLGAYRSDQTLDLAVSDFSSDGDGYDFTALSSIIDRFEMMDYDMGIPQGKISKTNTNSNLSTMQWGVRSFINKGIDPKQLISVLPLYGYYWTGVQGGSHGLGVEGTQGAGNYRYYQILPLLQEHPEFVYYDETQGDSWYYDPQTQGGLFIQFESKEALSKKMEFLQSEGVGGISIWAVDFDTPEAGGLAELSSLFRSKIAQIV